MWEESTDLGVAERTFLEFLDHSQLDKQKRYEEILVFTKKCKRKYDWVRERLAQTHRVLLFTSDALSNILRELERLKNAPQTEALIFNLPASLGETLGAYLAAFEFGLSVEPPTQRTIPPLSHFLDLNLRIAAALKGMGQGLKMRFLKTRLVKIAAKRKGRLTAEQRESLARLVGAFA